MGRSINKVEMKHIQGTGAFASNPGAKQRTFREEYVLYYSFIAFPRHY
jgi:CRISPR-associated protein Csh2